jgi:hypothetical protein
MERNMQQLEQNVGRKLEHMEHKMDGELELMEHNIIEALNERIHIID